MHSKFFIGACAGIFLLLSYLLFNQVSQASPHQDIDSKAYIENGKLFARDLSFAARKDFPYYVLGYPVFVGLIYRFFGQDNRWVIFFQIILSLISLILLFLITQCLFSTNVALIAAVLFSCNLGYLVFSQFILTEILLSLCLLVFFYYMSHYCLDPRQRFLIWAGIALGISVWIKPAALYFIVPLVPLIFFITKNSITQRLMHSVAFALAFTLPVIGIMIHNKIVFNEAKISKLDYVNIYFWFYANVRAEQQGTTSAHERVLLREEVQREGEGSIRRQFWLNLRSNPSLFAFTWMKNVMKTLLGLYTSNLKVLVEKNSEESISFFGQSGTMSEKLYGYITSRTTKQWVVWVGCFELIFNILRLLLCFLAMGLLLFYKRFALGYLFSIYCAYFSMITGHDGSARFRMMFDFVLIILMAYSMWWLIMRPHKKISHTKE